MVNQWRLEQILDKPVLIIRRFDREAQARIPFLSAISMLGAKDNEQHRYLEIAYALTQHGSAPNQDMEELWRRIIFTVLVSNTKVFCRTVVELDFKESCRYHNGFKDAVTYTYSDDRKRFRSFY